jgi:hypothetical protein
MAARLDRPFGYSERSRKPARPAVLNSVAAQITELQGANFWWRRICASSKPFGANKLRHMRRK